MYNKYYAMMYSHDGVLIVELDKYDEGIRQLLETLNSSYSLGGIINGHFVEDADLGCHLVSLDVFIKDETK